MTQRHSILAPGRIGAIELQEMIRAIAKKARVQSSRVAITVDIERGRLRWSVRIQGRERRQGGLYRDSFHAIGVDPDLYGAMHAALDLVPPMRRAIR